MSAWNFIVSLLSGAGISIVVGLIFIGRYQQKIATLEKAVPSLQEKLERALQGIARLEGQLSRMNGGR